MWLGARTAAGCRKGGGQGAVGWILPRPAPSAWVPANANAIFFSFPPNFIYTLFFFQIREARDRSLPNAGIFPPGASHSRAGPGGLTLGPGVPLTGRWQRA